MISFHVSANAVLLTMKVITVLPPLIEGDICAPDERQSVMVDLTVQWSQGFVDLRCRVSVVIYR